MLTEFVIGRSDSPTGAHRVHVVGFTRGLRELVADDGWVSIEVQHLLTLVQSAAQWRRMRSPWS